MKILVGDKRFAEYDDRVTGGDCGVSTDLTRLADRTSGMPVRGTMHVLPDPELRLARLSGTIDEPGVAP